MNASEVQLEAIAKLRAPSSFAIVESLFLRLLGIVYLSAFASLFPQVVGLIGSRGIEPAYRLMTAMRSQLGARAYFYAPSLFWFDQSDRMLQFVCALGCLASLLLVFQVFPRWGAIGSFILYLSITSVGQPFMGFQWDALLLEAGFLAIFAGAPWLVWVYRFLLFRLMFESGWVKIASHDPNWRNLHALRFHFMTQPLPNPIAYYAHHAPAAFLDALTAVTLGIEFAAPILLFAPRIARYFGVALLVALQICILLTGNYAFFNLLTLGLCLWGLDDRLFAKLPVLPVRRFPRELSPEHAARFRSAGNVAVVVLLILGAFQLLDSLAPRQSVGLAEPLALVQPFEIVNSYGLFAVMTTTRLEIVIEGSNDQTNWREYEFPYKPGNTHRSLPWIAPYQPRLDWQMWFAALGDYQNNSWVGSLLYRILTGEPSVYRLLERSRFERPPHYMRALVYQYDFTSAADRSRTGAVWQRQLRGVWFGPVSLTGQ